ncbi:MAG TPA: 4-hydroxythreonine-4-phosphate dehydrogenase PdxA [Sorangium sp.]|nr:4-hydroxythreonine-4-phosphate dehydrogenase PdxA [Sorangium sp.]
MASKHNRALAVSVGCPAGIGPQVALQAAASRPQTRCVLVGDNALLRQLAGQLNIDPARLVTLPNAAAVRAIKRGQIGLWQQAAALPRPIRPGHPTRAGGAAQLRWIDQACSLVEDKSCGALVTGPVSKEMIARGKSTAARRFRGHTEHLARRLDAGPVVMAFCSRKLTVSLATTHLPLRKVPRSLTQQAVTNAIVQLVRLLQRRGHHAPSVVVTGLNPHAGEGGLLGSEEDTIITPAMRRARALLRRHTTLTLSGPWGAESAFRCAAAGRFHGVVAMYHDQATIACKLLGFGEMVNVTLGLPIVRVSVDHGTAYDRAASGDASARGMQAALKLGHQLAAE